MGKGRSCGSWDAPGGGKGWGEDGGCGDRRVTGTGREGEQYLGGGSFFLKLVYFHRFRWQNLDCYILFHTATTPLSLCQWKAFAGPSGLR